MNKKLTLPQDEDYKYLSSIKFEKGEILKKATELSQTIKMDFPTVDIMIVLLEGGHAWGQDLLSSGLKVGEFIETDVSFYKSSRRQYHYDGNLEKVDFKDKNVLIVDDLVATGQTLAHVIEKVMKGDPNLVKACVMVHSAGRIKTEFDWIMDYMKYIGFTVNNDEFLAGHGIGTLNPVPKRLKYLRDIYSLKEIPKVFYELIDD